MTWHTQLNNTELSTMQMIQTSIVPAKMFILSKTTLVSILRMLLQNGMKPNPDRYQAMVLGKTEDKLNFKLADIDIKTTEKTCLLGVVRDNELKFDDHFSSIWSESKCSDKCSEHLKPRNRFIAHLYCRIFTIVTKSGTTAEKETLLKSRMSTKGL